MSVQCSDYDLSKTKSTRSPAIAGMARGTGDAVATGQGSEFNIICRPPWATRLPSFISIRSTVLPEFTFVSNFGARCPRSPFRGGPGPGPNIICRPSGATFLPSFTSMRSTALPEFTFVCNLGGPGPPFPPSVGVRT